MRLDHDTAARFLGIGVPALRVRLLRAKRQLNGFLETMCQHIDLGNPCRCEGRLEGALKKAFVAPTRLRSLPVLPFELRREDVGPLYTGLPESLAPGEDPELFESMLDRDPVPMPPPAPCEAPAPSGLTPRLPGRRVMQPWSH